MISGITMENWRSHENTELRFNKGANILIGQMGSGKTSVMNAISFALFGTFPDLQARKVKLDDAIMNKPSVKNHAKVSLDFEIAGKKYAIKREIGRGKGTTSATLWCGNKMLEGPNPKRVDDKIDELLKINYDLFSRAIYAEQNKIDYFLEIPKGQRKQKIDELLKIDKFENARKNVGTVISRLADRGEELEKFVASAPKVNTDELTKSVRSDRKQVETLGKEIKAAESEKDALKKKYSVLSEKKEKFESGRRKVEENAGRVSVLKEKVERYGKGIKSKGEIEKQHKELLSAKADAKKMLLEKASESEKLAGTIAKNNSKISEAEECLGILGENEKCPVCDTALERAKREEITGKKKAELESAKKEILDCRKKMEQIAKDRKTIEGKIDGFDEEARKLDKTAEYFSLKEDLEKHAALGEKLKKELAEISYDDKEVRKVYDEFKNCERELAVKKQKCSSFLELIKQKENEISKLDKIRKELERSAAEADYLKATNESLKTLQNVFQQTQGLLREQFTDTTNLLLTNVWEKLYPYKDYVDLKLAVDEAGDYVLQLKRRDGVFVNVEGIASGGERSISCLSLRIALSLVLTKNLSWLILDEPTHNLDRSGIRELSKTIREHLPEIVEQVFVITHEEELESAASGSLIRLERNKEEDEPTRIVAETTI